MTSTDPVVWPPGPPASVTATPREPPAAPWRSKVASPTPAGTVHVSSTPTGQVTVPVVPTTVGAEHVVAAAAGGTGPTRAGTMVASDSTKRLDAPSAASFFMCPPLSRPQLRPKTLRTVWNDPNLNNDH